MYWNTYKKKIDLYIKRLTLTWDVLKCVCADMCRGWHKININMRCIEILVTTPFICFHFAININMRCIEIAIYPEFRAYPRLTLTWDVLKCKKRTEWNVRSNRLTLTWDVLKFSLKW